jgi:hypothetical protein
MNLGRMEGRCHILTGRLFFNFPAQFFTASYLYRMRLAIENALFICKYVYIQESTNFIKI